MGNALIEQMAAEAGGRTSLSPRASREAGRTLIRVRADSRPESVIVRKMEVGRIETRSTDSKTDTVSEPKPALGRRIRSALDSLALLLVGMAAGYLIKTIRR